MNGRRLTAGAGFALAAGLVFALALAAIAGGVGSAVADGVDSSVAGGAGPGVTSEVTPTYVDDDVTDDTTWSAADGPYFVEDDVTVESGATLTIEAGTTVNVGEEVTVTVEGSFVTNGTAADPVEITSAEPSPSAGTWETIEYAGGSDSTLRLRHAVVEYGTTGVTVTSSAGTVRVAESTVREHVRSGLAVTTRDGAPTVRVADSRFASVGTAGVSFAVPETDPYVDAVDRVTIARSEFDSTGSYGVDVQAREISDVTLSDVAVTGVDRTGVRLATESTETRPDATNDHHATDVEVRNVRVANAGDDGIAFEGGALDDVAVRDSEIRGVGGAGVYVHDATDADRLRLDGNAVTDADTGIRLSLQRTNGGLAHVSLAVTDNEVARNDRYGVDADLGYVVVDSFDVRNNTVAANEDGGVRLRTQQFENAVVADNVVRGNDGHGVDVGAIRASGIDVTRNRVSRNDADGIVVHVRDRLGGLAVTDNVVLDNSEFGVDVEHGEPAGARNDLRENTVVANGDGVRVAGPTSTLLANNSVALNTAGREGDGASGREVDGHPGAGDATGVVVEDPTGNVELVHNDVYGHLTGLRSASNGTVDAEDNYWGADTGPYHATLNPDGTGDTVVTDRGKADPVPYASEPFGQVFERPTAVLTANETSVEPGDSVAFSARGSTDDARIVAYYFTVDGDRVSDNRADTHVTSFDEPGTYDVELAVEDETGVRSLDDATVSVTVRTAEETTQAPTTSNDDDTTTAAATTMSGGDQSGDGDSTDDATDDSLVASLFSVWGGLGSAFYLFAVGLGGYGTLLSMRGRDPPFSGATIHALAGLGVLTWAAAGVLVDGALLTVAGGGAAAWGGVTTAVLAVASR